MTSQRSCFMLSAAMPATRARRPVSAPAQRHGSQQAVVPPLWQQGCAPAAAAPSALESLAAPQKHGFRGSDPSRDLTQVHYARMQKTAAQRAAHMRDSEARSFVVEDRQVGEDKAQQRAEAEQRRAVRRPASAPLQRSASAASVDPRTASMQPQRPPAALPRRPYTALPGYSGYVPRKFADNVIGCTFATGNARARKLLTASMQSGVEC
mmetsp:Transcript_50406/g.141038  ORF Transcript_50406/g.141038 Transcript_50406/m.141038 type:complete len:209 (-) Transcript_50406:106-732(-)